jgi:hypothetical protein
MVRAANAASTRLADAHATRTTADLERMRMRTRVGERRHPTSEKSTRHSAVRRPIRYDPGMAAGRLFVITACTGAALLTVVACSSSSDAPGGTTAIPGVDASSGANGNDGSTAADGTTDASSGNEAGGDGGGDVDVPPRARATVTSALAACTDASSVVTLGSFAAPITTVEDGSTQGGLGVSVNCIVSQNAAMGFDIEATVSVSTVGSLHLQGSVDGTGATTTANVQLQKMGTGEWASTTGCTFDPNVSPGVSGVADGRLWVGVHCPAAATEGKPACDIDAEVRLENCNP